MTVSRDTFEECPRCGEEPTGVHARGPEVVVVPCGHTFDAMTVLEVPPEVRDAGEDGSDSDGE